jgi:hypothetical protein
MSVSDGQSLPSAFVPSKATEVPSWKTVYEKTFWELDTQRLLSLIQDTEDLLYLRWQEIGGGHAHWKELAAMKAAAEDLLAIKTHPLGWPSLGS